MKISCPSSLLAPSEVAFSRSKRPSLPSCGSLVHLDVVFSFSLVDCSPFLHLDRLPLLKLLSCRSLALLPSSLFVFFSFFSVFSLFLVLCFFQGLLCPLYFFFLFNKNLPLTAKKKKKKETPILMQRKVNENVMQTTKMGQNLNLVEES